MALLGGSDRQTEEKTKKELMLQILSYLDSHPEASDSIEGIANWWVPQQTIEYRVSLIKQTVNELVNRDLLVPDTRASPHPRFRVNHARWGNIEELLKDLL